MSQPPVTSANTPPLLRRLSVMRDEVGSATARIIDLVLEHPDEFLQWTIADVSGITNSSEATVVRLVQNLGFRSYQEFKLRLSRSLATREHSAPQQIEPHDPPEQVLGKTFGATQTALTDTLEHLDVPAFSGVVEALAQARRTEFIGLGNSALVARDAHEQFLRLGARSGVHTDPFAIVQMCALLEATDVLVAVSYSGCTADIVRGAELARENGAAVVALTGLGRTPLARLATHRLHVAAPSSAYRPEYVAARLAQMCVVDALVAALHLRGEPFASRRTQKVEAALRAQRESAPPVHKASAHRSRARRTKAAS